ncbi:MAG: hypothetical protein NTY15_13595 [Planctomycetota bacterium]|nr:hypothetical protein [Planctomycetota bacterium]
MSEWKLLEDQAEQHAKQTSLTLRQAITAASGRWCDAMTTDDRRTQLRSLAEFFSHLRQANRLHNNTIDSLRIGTPPRKAIDVFNAVLECFDRGIRTDMEIPLDAIRRLADLNGLPHKPNEVIAITEQVEEFFSKPEIDSSKYPGLKQMYRDTQANTKLAKPEKTYKKVCDRYYATLDRNDRPTVEKLKRWLERNH